MYFLALVYLSFINIPGGRSEAACFWLSAHGDCGGDPSDCSWRAVCSLVLEGGKKPSPCISSPLNICVRPEAPSQPGLRLAYTWKVTADKQSWEIFERILLTSENSVQVGQTCIVNVKLAAYKEMKKISIYSSFADATCCADC